MKKIVFICLLIWVLLLCMALTGCSHGLVYELLESWEQKEQEHIPDADFGIAETPEDRTQETMDTEAEEQAVGLSYALTKQGNAYEVVGIGDCVQSKIVIPSTYQGLPVTKIAMGAFEGSAIPVEVIIPHSVYLIDTESFRNCVNLESVYIPNSVTIIGDAVFQECPKIKSFEIPASVQRIGIGAFSAGAGLESITVGLGNPSYYSKNNCLIERETGRLISGCSNSTIPDEVKIIGYIAFQGCVDMKEAIIPEGVVAIHEMAFEGCSSIEYASLPSTLQIMEGFAFYQCVSLKEVVIAEGVKEIGLCAFFGTAITELRIPESVTKLGSQFAEGCKKLKTVYLPKGLITIGISAFEDCKALKSVYYSGTVQQWHAVTKDIRWDANTASYTVYCSDGEVKK